MYDNDLERAKQAIERGDYQRARTILEMMPDNRTAQKWLFRLNRKNLKFRHDKDITPKSRRTTPRHEKEIPALALLTIVLSMLFWALFLISTAAMNPQNSQAQAKTVLFVLGLAFGLPVLYSLFWRWFWWMLALSWVLGTLAFIVALAMGWQMPILFA